MDLFFHHPVGSYVYENHAIYQVVAHLAGPTKFDGFLALTHVVGKRGRATRASLNQEQVVAGELPDVFVRSYCGCRGARPIPVKNIARSYIAGVSIFHTITTLICIIGEEGGDESVGIPGFAFSYQPTVDDWGPYDGAYDATNDPDVEVGAWLYDRVPTTEITRPNEVRRSLLCVPPEPE